MNPEEKLEAYLKWKTYGVPFNISSSSAIDRQIMEKIAKQRDIHHAELIWLMSGVEPEPEIKELILQRRKADARFKIEEEAMRYWWDEMSVDSRETFIQMYISLKPGERDGENTDD